MSEDITGMSPAKLRAMANKLECEADMCAITYRDATRRREATAWHRQRVRELRAHADRIESMHAMEDPPTAWCADGPTVAVDEEIGIYASFDNTDTPNPTLWHWCTEAWGGGQWIPSGTGAHTLVSADPLHLEPSCYWPTCCGLHGWIRDGHWTSA